MVIKLQKDFVIWLEYQYNSSIIDQLDKSLKEITYNQSSTWSELKRRSIEQLWSDYTESPCIINNIPFITPSTTTIEMTTETVEIHNITATKSQIDEKINITDSVICI